MLRVLIAGFEPFGTETINPAREAVVAFEGGHLPGIALRTLVLPTRFDEARARLDAALDGSEADVAVAIGLAGGRVGLTVERVAINLDDARIPDTAGFQPIDRTIIADGPAAYFSTLPVKAMVSAIRKAGLEASVSHSAGTFVCNHVFYGLCHRAATIQPGLRCGFVHIPWLPEQADRLGGAALSTADAVRGLRAALSAIAAGSAEPATSEGALS